MLFCETLALLFPCAWHVLCVPSEQSGHETQGCNNCRRRHAAGASNTHIHKPHNTTTTTTTTTTTPYNKLNSLTHTRSGTCTCTHARGSALCALTRTASQQTHRHSDTIKHAPTLFLPFACSYTHSVRLLRGPHVAGSAFPFKLVVQVRTPFCGQHSSVVPTLVPDAPFSTVCGAPAVPCCHCPRGWSRHGCCSHVTAPGVGVERSRPA